MGQNKFYMYNQFIHSIPANTKRQLTDRHLNVQTSSGITLNNTINEKKKVTKYFNGIQINKNVEKKTGTKTCEKQTCKAHI